MKCMQTLIPNDGPYTVTLDDDPTVAHLIQQILSMKTVAYTNLTDLKANVEELKPIAVFVDIHLENGDCGLDYIPDLKARWPLSPIIVMTSDHDESMVSNALALGADDFILKPIRHGELLARFLARKAEIELRNSQTILTFGDMSLNIRYKSLSGPKGSVFISPMEVEILCLLIRTKGALVDKNTLKGRVWGSISVGENALDRKLFDVRKAIRAVSEMVELRSRYRHGVELVCKPNSHAEMIRPMRQEMTSQSAML